MSLFISEAYADAATSAAPGSGLSLFFLVGMFALFYFILIRPQQKRAKEHKKLIESLAKGDEIVTTGGLLGKIAEAGDQYITLELTKDMQVKLQRHAVSMVLPKGTLKASQKE